MTTWMIRFIPYSSSMIVDAFYSTHSAALQQFEALAASGREPGTGARVDFADGFGARLSFAPSQGTLVLTDTDTLARIGAAVHRPVEGSLAAPVIPRLSS